MKSRHKPEREQTGLRVAMYVYDCGAFLRSYIQANMSEEEYRDINSNSRNRRVVILPPDDPYGSKMYTRVTTWSLMEQMVRDAEDKYRRCNYGNNSII